MFLYYVTQDENCGYDTYDSMIVAAKSEEDARLVHPAGYTDLKAWKSRYSSWATSPDNVSVVLIGVALEDQKEEVIIASFNAG